MLFNAILLEYVDIQFTLQLLREPYICFFTEYVLLGSPDSVCSINLRRAVEEERMD